MAENAWAGLPDAMPAADRQAIEQDEAWVASVARRASALYRTLLEGGVPPKTAGHIVECYCGEVFHGDPAYGVCDG